MPGPIRTGEWDSCTIGPSKGHGVHKKNHWQLMFLSGHSSKCSLGIILWTEPHGEWWEITANLGQVMVGIERKKHEGYILQDR
jgi:hypothetical protein